ncbi:hypothetical protein V502_06694 [Pseudogymnoascus sp. VKM F-4520 (FW-2644)]|nr:hypothetical protein V502_06694 [Pseudogymnoascus sp. VKM F-4520 (FW-2644)]
MEDQTSPRAPIWVPIVRGIQFLLALIILGLSAYIIHGYYFNTLGFTIFCSLLTWLLVAYYLTTEFIPSLSHLRHLFVVIGTDALMVIFWLSGMGAAAALRASFTYDVHVDGCVDDGSLVGSTTCVVERKVEKRMAVVFAAGLSSMSAVAGLSALEMLLFIATLVYYVRTWYQGRETTTATTYTPQKQEEGYAGATQQPYVQQPQTQQPYVQQPQTQQPYVQQEYVQPVYQQQPYSVPHGQQAPH